MTSIVLVSPGLGSPTLLPFLLETRVRSYLGWAGQEESALGPPGPGSRHSVDPLKELLCENEQQSSGTGDKGLV